MSPKNLGVTVRVASSPKIDPIYLDCLDRKTEVGTISQERRYILDYVSVSVIVIQTSTTWSRPTKV